MGETQKETADGVSLVFLWCSLVFSGGGPDEWWQARTVYWVGPREESRNGQGGTAHWLLFF